jgi:hypothetical protein
VSSNAGMLPISERCTRRFDIRSLEYLRHLGYSGSVALLCWDVRSQLGMRLAARRGLQVCLPGTQILHHRPQRAGSAQQVTKLKSR